MYKIFMKVDIQKFIVYKIESIDGSLAHPSSPHNDSITTVTTPSLLTYK
jgi:hypothetical protein